MPKRKPLKEKFSPQRLMMSLLDGMGFYIEDKSRIAKMSKLPLWVVDELSEANALYDDNRIDYQLLEVLSYYFYDQRFLSSALKQIKKSYRAKVLFPEDHNPVKRRIESIIKRRLAANQKVITNAVIAEVTNVYPKTAGKYKNKTLKKLVCQARKKEAYEKQKTKKKKCLKLES